ncbi:MAG: quinonprotein alcohol dehydrogenase [Gemmataceae bacterium]|nr:quinonprotein alcohol dehydrogenase [Gemmataceae bacterium]
MLTLLLAILPAADLNWPSYRGAQGDGHAQAANLPAAWSEKENVLWKIAVPGRAWASPVIWGNQIWLSNASEDGKKLGALAIDKTTGKALHDLNIFQIEKPMFIWKTNSYASSTPVIEEGRVYLHYGSAGTACIDTETGKTVWARQDIPCNHWRGAGSSPILFNDFLILTFDGYDQQYLAALDKKTGKTIWRTDRTIQYNTDNGDLKKGFSTPAIFEINGKLQMVSPAAVGTVAYDPLTGKELWKVHHGGMNAACRPLLVDGKVLVTTGDGGWKFFAVRPDGAGDVSTTHVEWKTIKGVPSRSSPLLVNGKVFAVNEAGVLSEFDPKNGNVVKQERLGGTFSASPLLADGRIYLFNEQGEGFVVVPGENWKALATNKLESGCMASPAAVGDLLIVRTMSHLYALKKK